MAKRIVKCDTLRLDATGTNGLGEKVVNVNLWGNSYHVVQRKDAAAFAAWLEKEAIPFLREFAKG